MKKLILSISFILCFSFDAMAKSDCESGEQNCWDCGKTEADLCTARLNNTTKELKITGNGEMRDYSYAWGGWSSDPPPWGNSYSNLRIENGIKSLGNWAFTYSNITSVDLPDSVQSIGAFALDSCYSLTNISIPDSVTTIGEKAFGWTPYYGKRMDNLFIPESVTSILSDAFYDAPINTVYCAESTGCPTASNIKIYTKDKNGIYKTEGLYYASPDDMIAKLSCGANDTGDGPSDLCKTKAEEYKNQKAESMAGGALCATKAGCLKLLSMAQNGTYCTTIASCKAYGDENGISFSNQDKTKNADGSYTLYDENGNIIGFQGKRIYTINEATLLTKPQGNTFKIRYR